MLKYKALFRIILLSILPLSLPAQLKLSPIFSDGMILQRNKPVKVWGWSQAEAEIEVRFKDQFVQTNADAEGQWTIELSPLSASSTPQSLSISDNNQTIKLNDVLVGDVWLCSGQSNMEWSINRFPYAQSESDATRFPNLRMFTVQKSLAPEEQTDIPGGQWLPAEGKHILNFSATAHFFGKKLHQDLHIPIGLIVSSWGGTNVEAWIPPKSWQAYPDLKDIYTSQQTKLQAMDLPARKQALDQIIKENVYDGIGIAENWQNPEADLSDWSDIIIPQEKGNALFRDLDGAVWLRKSFEIPLPFRGKDLKANLGQMNDHDMVWVNGHQIGESQNKNAWRNYVIDQAHLKKGQNEIVIRIFDYEGDGGYVTDPYFINLHPLEDSRGYYLLSGDWKYKVGKTLDQPLKLPYVPANQGRLANITPSSLYHQMIHPLRHLAISGAIWYQGESNASRGYEYQYFFPSMIKGWRAAFAQGDFPFLFVQLPNFHGKSRDGALANWPELRHAQAIALKLPKTEMAVTIDIGEENNIHPPNKQDVGQRLALAALNLHYQKDIPYQGPILQKVKAKKNKLLLTFQQTGDGLIAEKKIAHNGQQINNFEIAGTDQEFHPAQARIVGKNQISLWSKAVPNPKEVRYAWTNNPTNVNLYNSHGLPTAPFRTDEWDWKTKENKYINQIK